MTATDEDQYLDKLKPVQGRSSPNRITRLIFEDELEEITDVSAMTRWRWMRDGKFPLPVPMGNKRGPKRRAWLGPEVEAWINAEIAERDSQNRDD